MTQTSPATPPRKLLLIHTGGTIGMAPTSAGLAPQPGLVEEALTRRLPPGVTLETRVFTPLLDSADVGPMHWNRILDEIDAMPGLPVIVTHGTDTMTFTGAALTRALTGSDRHVVLCGAMVPLGMAGDAEANLDQALAAALGGGRGVELAFAGRVMPAGALIKRDSHEADAFTALPQPEGISAPAPRQRRFTHAAIAILTLSPGLSARALAAALSGVDHAVLRVFGSGTAMADPSLHAAIARAIGEGKRIRAVSQCPSGGLAPGTYAAGAGLWASGVENGGAETPEAAMMRLWLD